MGVGAPIHPAGVHTTYQRITRTAVILYPNIIVFSSDI